MEGHEDFVVDSGMQYADIIVPTMDTVRSSYLIELLLTNGKKVSPPYTVHDATSHHLVTSTTGCNKVVTTLL